MMNQNHRVLLLATIIFNMAAPGFCATAEFYKDRAFAKEAKKDFDGAIADYTKAIKLAPKDPDAYTFRGIAKNHKGDIEGAIADYTSAIEIANHPYDERWIALAYSSRGAAKQEKGDLDGAIADYTEAIPHHAKDDAHRDLFLAGDYTSRGIAKQNKGDFDGAIADYTKALTFRPNDPAASKQLSAAKLAKPIALKIAAAGCCFTTADDYFNAGFVKAAEKNFSEAIADYTKALELKPNDPVAYSARGNAKRDNGDFDGAIADYTKTLELRPNNPATYSARGSAKRDKGDFDGAIADYTKALELKPNDPATSEQLHAATYAKLAKPIDTNYFSSFRLTDRKPVAYRAYSGPALPPQHKAILTLNHVLVSNVDGQRLPLCYSGDITCTPIGPIELLPGEHSITFSFGNDPKNTLAPATISGAPPIQRSLTVEAGKVYSAQRHWQNAGDCTVSRGSTSSTVSCQIVWSVDITEK